MIVLWIGLGVFSVFMLLLFLGVCRLSAEADERMEAAYQKMLESRAQEDGNGFLREGGEP